MSKGGNSPGISRLAGVLKKLADGQVPKDLLIDFGVIQADGSLLTNTFTIPIPKRDYQVCGGLKARTETTSSADGHTHTVTTRALEIGDRVLVAWVQNDAVVIDVLEQAADVL